MQVAETKLAVMALSVRRKRINQIRDDIRSCAACCRWPCFRRGLD